MGKKIFVCNECGFESVKWFGACPSCKAYNTFFEQKQNTDLSIANVNQKLVIQTGKITQLSDVVVKENQRIMVNNPEIDRVFGQGIVEGSFTLIGGQPGIGKSTLMLQMVSEIAKEKRVLYVSGEESLSQIKLRAIRLGISNSEAINMLSTNNLNYVLEVCQKAKIEVLIIDSIQTLYLEGVNSLQGTSAQLKACTMELMKHAKVNDITTLIIGHITKEGEIAGPKQLEHMVDTVLYLEMETDNKNRILRSFKNRFGSINEIGVFTMNKSGLKPWEYPTNEILNNNQEVGNTRTLSIAGDRVFITEVQALINPIDFGNPKRITTGVEQNRLNILVALLENKTKLDFKTEDIFLKNNNPIGTVNNLLDLAIVISLVALKLNRPIKQNQLFIGSISLSGKIEPLEIEQNLKLLSQAGFKQIIGNVTNRDSEIPIIKVQTLTELLNYVFK